MASRSTRTWTAPDGKKKSAYVVRYFSGGKHRQRTFAQAKAADAFKRKVSDELEAGSHIPQTDKVTVAVVCDLFLKHQEDRRRDGRIGGHHLRTTTYAVDKSIGPRLGDKLYADLTMADVEGFYRDMVRIDRLAPTTAKMRVATLQQVEIFAQRRGLTHKTPVKRAFEDLRGVAIPAIRTFTPDEISDLLRSVEQRHRAVTEIRSCFVVLW